MSRDFDGDCDELTSEFREMRTALETHSTGWDREVAGLEETVKDLCKRMNGPGAEGGYGDNRSLERKMPKRYASIGTRGSARSKTASVLITRPHRKRSRRRSKHSMRGAPSFATAISAGCLRSFGRAFRLSTSAIRAG